MPIRLRLVLLIGGIGVASAMSGDGRSASVTTTAPTLTDDRGTLSGQDSPSDRTDDRGPGPVRTAPATSMTTAGPPPAWTAAPT